MSLQCPIVFMKKNSNMDFFFFFLIQRAEFAIETRSQKSLGQSVVILMLKPDISRTTDYLGISFSIHLVYITLILHLYPLVSCHEGCTVVLESL